jgi:hypothetical protein
MGHDKTATKTAISPLSGAAIPLGAHPGNTGGKKGRSGRLPSKVREACRLAFHQRLKVLKQIADNEHEDAADRIRAVDTLGKYGGIQKIEHTGADDGPIQVNVVELRERIAGRLARLASSN